MKDRVKKSVASSASSVSACAKRFLNQAARLGKDFEDANRDMMLWFNSAVIHEVM